MTDSKVNIPADYFRTEGEVPNAESKQSFASLFEQVVGEGAIPPSLEMPDHVVVGTEYAIDLGDQTLADGTPLKVVRTTVDTMLAKSSLSPGISIAENHDNVQGMRRLSHSARINMLNEKDRENFDEVMTYMREDNRTQSHIQRVQESLLDKAGIPTFYSVEERPQPMEMWGHWFNPVTGERVDNPNVTYRRHELVNNQFDRQYNANLLDILQTGEPRLDRTGIGTLMKFGTVQHHIDLREGFPATTGKKFAFETMKKETIKWMLEGKFDLKSLKDMGVRIWDQNVKAGTEVYGEMLTWADRIRMLTPGQLKSFTDYKETYFERDDATESGWLDYAEMKLNNWGVPDRALIDGDLGPIYGKQWRAWEDIRIVDIEDWAENWKSYRDRGFDAFPEGYFEYDDRQHDRPVRTHAIIKREIDQIANIEIAIQNELKFHNGEIYKHSEGRRIILTGWNVAQLDEMSLPPCHTLAQWSVSQTKDENGRNYLDCELYQRSNDMFLGCPFNVAQYALITEMLAHAHGMTARWLHHTIGDAHIYQNHIEGDDGVKALLQRPIIHNSPRLHIAGEHTSILDIKIEDVTMSGYESHPPFVGVPIAK
jgi:thymidylate synthase